MNEIRWERLGAASGFAVVVLGAAGASFERGAPNVSATGEEVAAYFAENRDALLAQSLLFVLSAGAFLWFLGSLRDFLARAEGGTGRLAAVAFGAGGVGISIIVLIQAPQIALAVASRAEVEPGLAGMIAGLGYALITIAYVPLAVMFGAVAMIVFSRHGVPGLVRLAVRRSLRRLSDDVAGSRGGRWAAGARRRADLRRVPDLRCVADRDHRCDDRATAGAGSGGDRWWWAMNEVIIPTPGGEMAVYVATLDGDGPWPGVVVVHDALGMTTDLRNQAD